VENAHATRFKTLPHIAGGVGCGKVERPRLEAFSKSKSYGVCADSVVDERPGPAPPISVMSEKSGRAPGSPAGSGLFGRRECPDGLTPLAIMLSSELICLIPMNCFWCHADCRPLTDDHIIPYSLGGPADCTVKACANCQHLLSKAEHEVARKSILAFHALASSVAPRHPKRPTSGNLKPVYLLVKHPDGGYGETLFSSGERVSLLPYFEIKVVPGEPIEGRVRGTTDEARRLLDVFRKALQRKPDTNGPLIEVSVSCELGAEVADDKDFWPRILLLPGDRLLIRGRNPDEVMRFVRVFMQLAVSDYAVPKEWTSNGGEIKGGTPHLLAVSFDPQAVRRVAAKIVYGIFIKFADGTLDDERDAYFRNYILGAIDSDDEPVYEAPIPLTITTSNAPHRILLSPEHDRKSGFVSLYNHFFRIEFGPRGALRSPTALICHIDGSCLRQATADELVDLLRRVSEIRFTQPWRASNDVRSE